MLAHGSVSQTSVADAATTDKHKTIPAARKGIALRLTHRSLREIIQPIARTGCGSQCGSPSATSSAMAIANSHCVTDTTPRKDERRHSMRTRMRAGHKGARVECLPVPKHAAPHRIGASREDM